MWESLILMMVTCCGSTHQQYSKSHHSLRGRPPAKYHEHVKEQWWKWMKDLLFFSSIFFKHWNSPLFSNSAVILDVMDKCDTIFLYCSWKPGTTLSGSVVCQGFTLKFPPLKWDKHVLSRNFGRRRESAYGPWCRTAEFAWHDINGRTRRRRAEGGEAQNKCSKNFLVIRPTSLPVCPFTSSWVAIRSTLKCRRFLHHR